MSRPLYKTSTGAGLARRATRVSHAVTAQRLRCDDGTCMWTTCFGTIGSSAAPFTWSGSTFRPKWETPSDSPPPGARYSTSRPLARYTSLHLMQRKLGLPRFGWHRLRHTHATN